MPEHIAIITVVYKNYTVLEDFVKSLDTQISKNFHLFIADASPVKQSISANIPYTVIPIENHGYAYGVNEGIKKALEQGITQYCVINDDTYFNADFTRILERIFTTQPETLFGGKIYYAPGHEYHTQRYTKENLGRVIWYAGGLVDWNHAWTTHRGVDEVDHGQFNTEEKTESITGCLLCFDKKVLDAVGYWDSNYFMYYEDADYCERAKKQGFDLFYNPELVIWHKNGQSTEGAGSLLHEKYQKTSRIKFALKYAPLKTKLHILKNYFFS